MNCFRVTALIGLLVACLYQISAANVSTTQIHAQRTTLLGQALSDAERLEFFKFFNFSKIEELPDAAHSGMSLHLYGTGGDFKGSATLLISTKSNDDIINVAGLMLCRDFIENPRTAMFARDFVKSFIELSPGFNSTDIATLHSEIWYGCHRGMIRYSITPQGSISQQPCDEKHKKSLAYHTYLGHLGKYKITRAGGYLMLQNSTKVVRDVPLLFVEMGNE